MMLKLARERLLRQKFDRPIPIVNHKPLFGPADVIDYIVSLPPAEQQAPAWKTAAELLMQVAEHDGDVTPTRIAVLHALHHREPASLQKRRGRTVRIFR